MSVITGEYKDFVSAEEVYSKVKRRLRSYSITNIISESEFPTYTYEVLSKLKNGAYKESEALLPVVDYKTTLPEDFKTLHAAYKCKPMFYKVGENQLQSESVIYNDITREIICTSECGDNATVLDSYTIKQYYNEGLLDYKVSDKQLLRLSPNVKDKCSEDCMNINASSSYEITIKGKTILCNFTDDYIYLLYYGMPVDQYNIPLIPDIEEFKKALEWYIIYQVTLDWWMNNEAPDIQAKWQKAEMEYNDAMAAIRHLNRLPSFNRSINYARNKRSINMVSAFSQFDRIR